MKSLLSSITFLVAYDGTPIMQGRNYKYRNGKVYVKEIIANTVYAQFYRTKYNQTEGLTFEVYEFKSGWKNFTAI